MSSNEIFPAHIRVSSDGKQTVQTVVEHCRNVAEFASDNLEGVSLKSNAYLAGLLHDMGKSTDRFRCYITDASAGRPVVRGSVNHTFAGVRYVQTELKGERDVNAVIDILTRDLVSYAIGAHHGQFDCTDEDGRDGFEYRIQKKDIDYEEAVREYFASGVTGKDLAGRFDQACMETKELLSKLQNLAERSTVNLRRGHLDFYLGATARLLQSALIDADRRDTAQFMQEIEYPSPFSHMTKTWEKELAYAEERMSVLKGDTAINRARRDISDLCRKAAIREGGIYRLNVPTGAGKTLSSLRFALAHSAHWNKSRIIFAAPLLTILEQNAAVIRNYIEDQTLILEHHSNVVQPDNRDDELSLSELYTENWDAPIIITTLVQLLDTMFSGKTTCIRRFHSLCNCVIVIDEIQSVPSKLLTLFNLMISFLSEICGATVVLCSATQPYLEGCEHAVAVVPKELVPYNRQVWEVFRRTEIVPGGKCRTEELAGTITSLVGGGAGSVLVVCNKKSESEKLYRELSEQYDCCHLSASMCTEHRRKALSKLKSRMYEQNETPFICVSTQVIEAGVDISFDCVIRLMAGMDSCVQAAGRCNRNGEKESGTVYILNCTDERLSMLEEIRRGKDATGELFYDYSRDPARFRNDLSSEEAIRRYYMNYYRSLPRGYQDDMISGKKASVYSLLSSNIAYVSAMGRQSERPHLLHQAFREAGRYFHVFDEETCDVIVPYGDGRMIISDLLSERAAFDSRYRKKCLKAARGYTVTLYPEQKRMLEGKGAVMKVDDLDVYILSDGYYDPDTGIVMEPGGTEYMEI